MDNTAKLYKIYFLRDPSTGLTKYVGKTITSLSDRLSAHITQAKSCEYNRYDWIKDLLEKGLKPEIHLITEIEEKDWDKAEVHWINTFRLMGYELENKTDGGEGSFGCFPSDATREKMAESAKNRKPNPAKIRRDMLDNIENGIHRPKVKNFIPNITNQPPITQALEIKIMDPSKMKFAALVADDWTLMDAFKEAFPELSSSKWVSRYAHRLAKDPKIREQVEELQQAMRVQFIINAPRALDRLEEIAETSKNERVKLDANIEILNRAGMQAPQRIETLHIGLWGRLSSEDIRGMIKSNIDNLASSREEGK